MGRTRQKIGNLDRPDGQSSGALLGNDRIELRVEGSEGGNERGHAKQEQIGVQKERHVLGRDYLVDEVKSKQKGTSDKRELHGILRAHRFQLILDFVVRRAIFLLQKQKVSLRALQMPRIG